MTRASKIKVEEKCPISEQGYIVGKLLSGTECQIFLDMEVSKSFMSKLHYLRCKSFTFITKVCIQKLKEEIHENVDIFLGIKNISELEGIINSMRVML